MMLGSLLVAALAAFSPIPAPVATAPKAVSHVDMLDRETVLVVYTDMSMAVGPLSSFGSTGLPLAGAPLTTVEPPTSDELVTRWTDAKGLQREVRTNCATLKPIDCVTQHQRIVDLMLQVAPAPKPAEPSK